MHGISLRGLPWGHVEEARVKKSRLFNEASVRRMTCIPYLARRIKVFIYIESIFRNLEAVSVGMGMDALNRKRTRRWTSNPASSKSQNFSWSAASGNRPAIPTMASFGFREVLGASLIVPEASGVGAFRWQVTSTLVLELKLFASVVSELLGPIEISSHFL